MMQTSAPARADLRRTDEGMTRETDDLIMRIERSEERITQRMIRDRSIGLFNVDLSVQQLRALMVVAASARPPRALGVGPAGGGLSPTERAGARGVGAPRAPGIGARWEGGGLPARRPAPAARRARRVELTDEGRRLLPVFNESSGAR